MTTAEILAHINEIADGLEDAILGILQGCCHPTVICYDYDLCVECLMRQGMSEEDADEWMTFNVLGAYMGKGTPLFLLNLRAREA